MRLVPRQAACSAGDGMTVWEEWETEYPHLCALVVDDKMAFPRRMGRRLKRLNRYQGRPDLDADDLCQIVIEFLFADTERCKRMEAAKSVAEYASDVIGKEIHHYIARHYPDGGTASSQVIRTADLWEREFGYKRSVDTELDRLLKDSALPLPWFVLREHADSYGEAHADRGDLRSFTSGDLAAIRIGRWGSEAERKAWRRAAGKWAAVNGLDLPDFRGREVAEADHVIASEHIDIVVSEFDNRQQKLFQAAWVDSSPWADIEADFGPNAKDQAEALYGKVAGAAGSRPLVFQGQDEKDVTDDTSP